MLQPVPASDENMPSAPVSPVAGVRMEPAKVGFLENEPKLRQSEQPKRRAVLGEITNITNIIDQGKKSTGVMPKVVGGVVGGLGVFAGAENNIIGSQNLTATPASARGPKLLPTKANVPDAIFVDEDSAQNVPPGNADSGLLTADLASKVATSESEDVSECEAAVDDATGLNQMEDTSELPSMGSVEHHAGTCKRCNFFPKGRCQNGKDCTFCHFPHDKRKPSRQEKRERRAAWLAQQDGEPYEDSEDDEDGEDGEEHGEVQHTMAYSILPGLPPMRATKLPTPLALPGSCEAPGFSTCLPPGLPPPQHSHRAAPPMLGLDIWQPEEEISPIMRCSPTAATARSMSVLSTVPMSTPSLASASPMAFASFLGCSAPPTPTAASTGAPCMVPIGSPPGSFSTKVMCTIATQTEKELQLCQKCCKHEESCMCASSSSSGPTWSREEMLRMREAIQKAGRANQPAAVRTVSSASVDGQ